jgi:hypothetical protein
LKLKDSINQVVCWANDKDYVVLFEKDGDDSVDCCSKVISIKSTNVLETQLYVLLHECGHILIDENSSVFNFKEVYCSFGEKSKTYKSFRIMEEVEAWKRGRTLADRLYIDINQEKWDRAVARAIYKYMEWAVS